MRASAVTLTLAPTAANKAIAGPVNTAQVLYFIKLLDKKEGSVPTLAQIHDRLVALLRACRARQLQEAYLSELGNKLSITVDQIELAKLRPALK